ncbi:uncharacterized protein JCM6883_005448 [Sporobolomyces salmoneus]|uniref:uncharacterized protein n=1 Tax=Sporobolomyces salmoneus TaxID=183962 RepID=UPI00317F9056
MNDLGKKRGRKVDSELPPSRSRDVQRAFRARRAAHLTNLENRNCWLEEEVAALKAKLGMREQDYASGPPPKEVEPDYEGVAEPGRVRGSNKRTKRIGVVAKKQLSDEGLSTDAEWLSEYRAGENEANSLGSIDDGGGGNQFFDTQTTSHRTTESLPIVRPHIDSPPSCPQFSNPPPIGSMGYGIFFIPKGSEQASFVGNTEYPPNFGCTNTTAQDLPSPFPTNSRSPLPTLGHFISPPGSRRPLTSPDSISSIASVATNGLPATPPDGWVQPQGQNSGPTTHSRSREEETKETFQAFHRAMSRAFGKGQAADTNGDYSAFNHSTTGTSSTSATSHDNPLPCIRLPRFSSGLPGSGSASSSSSPATDTYLHVTKVFEQLSRFLLSSSSPATQLSPSRLVSMLQAQDRQNSLLSDSPESFDFSRPPTCLFLPPFSSSSAQPHQFAGGRREMYVLARAVEQVGRDLEARDGGSRYYA